MTSTTGFWLNNEPVSTCLAPGTPVLDFLRGERGLTGTKEGCREGDCGACAVLVGEILPGSGESAIPRYRAVPSCMLALGELRGKHLVTIEGLSSGAPGGLTPVMNAFLEENAVQCGFCSPGFVIALSAWLAEPGVPDLAGALRSADGNLCRCTGYGAIRRAAERLAREFRELPPDPGERLEALVEREVLPGSVLAFADAAAGFADSRPGTDSCGDAGGPVGHADNSGSGVPGRTGGAPSVVLGGGTDWFVRNPEPPEDFSPGLLKGIAGYTGIRVVDLPVADTLVGARIGGAAHGPAGGETGAAGVPGGGQAAAHPAVQPFLEIGAAVTVRDFFASGAVRECVPGIEAFEGQFASTLIRNLATLGGNLANASPVGDLTSMLLALGAHLEIERRGSPGQATPGKSGAASGHRHVALEDFFLGYKKVDLGPDEAIRTILLPAARPGLRFSFEKVAKRRNLDIAAVNTAMSFRVADGRISGARLSAGGVAPVPLLLAQASALMEGAEAGPGVTAAALARLARSVASAAEAEITPIGDVRGSAAYRRALAGRLVLGHFIRLFPESGIALELFP